MKSISAIAAVDQQWGIGKNNQLPWHSPTELALFSSITKGNVLIMGRKTYQSLPKPTLEGRKIIVVSRKGNVKVDKLKTVWCENGIYTAVAKAMLVAPHDEIIVAGGQKIYEQAMPLIDKIYLSVFNETYDCDRYFPALDVNTWQVQSKAEYEDFTHYLYRKAT